MEKVDTGHPAHAMFAAGFQAGTLSLYTVHSLRSSARLLATLLLLVTLLFSRLAFAYYACPASQLPAVAMVQMNGANCTELADHSKMVDEMQPALCAQHCADEPQIASDAIEPRTSAPVLLQIYPSAPRSLALDAVEPAWLRLTVAWAPRGPGGGDALFLQTRRLRI